MKRLIGLLIFVGIGANTNAQTIDQIKDNILSANAFSPKGFTLEKIVKVIPPLEKIYDCWLGERILFSSPVKLADYVSTLGIMCKQELKLDKITPMPVRFRLGSLEYVNWLERKPNAINSR